MNKLLLSAVALTLTFSSAVAYEHATPDMMKSSLKPISTRTLPTGETEVTLGIPMKLTGENIRMRDARYMASSVDGLFNNAVTRAESEPYMQFNYCGSPAYANYMDNVGHGERVFLTVYFPEMYTKMYNNCRVKDLTFMTGINAQTEKNQLTNTTLFIAKNQTDIPGNMAYNRNVRVTDEAYSPVTLEFAEDFIIKEGEPFFLGYAVTPTEQDYFIVTDGDLTDDAYGALVGVYDGEKTTWDNAGPELGNLCIYVTIVGEDLPKNGATIYNMNVPMQVTPNEPFSVGIDVINMNSNDITSLEYTYKVGEAEMQTETMELPAPLPYGDVAPLTIAGLQTAEIGLNIPFEFNITKVNGVDNYYQYGAESMYFKSFDQSKGFTPHSLIEEGTGTWCGYCPIGISMMEYAAENYPDYYHRAALHYSAQGAPDPMNVPSISEMLRFFTVFPTALFNRWASFHPGNYKQLIPAFYEYYGGDPAAAGISDLEVVNSADNSATVSANVQFALDLENAGRFRMGLYITEDNVGPYEQTNFYAGAQEDCDGWEKMPEKIRRQMFDDVVRYMAGGAMGIENSLPEAIKAGESYPVSVKADLSAVAGEEYNVILFVYDNESEEVLNSAILATDKSAAVDEIESVSRVNVYGLNGEIVLHGEYAKATVISIDGKVMAELNGEESVKLAAGVYIVNVDGKSHKVIVK